MLELLPPEQAEALIAAHLKNVGKQRAREILLKVASSFTGLDKVQAIAEISYHLD